MTKAEIMRRLHAIVDQLESVPDEWFEEGIYPLHEATFVSNPGFVSSEERITLVVGVKEAER